MMALDIQQTGAASVKCTPSHRASLLVTDARSARKPANWCKRLYHHPLLLFSGTSPPALSAASHMAR